MSDSDPLSDTSVSRNLDAAHALLATIAQIGVALRESQDPVTELACLFSHQTQTLTALRSVPLTQSGADTVAAATMLGLFEQLQTDVFKGVQQLQFYDRMVQHLSHLQAYLIAVANELGSIKSGEEAREAWDDLNSTLRRRLISDEQRGLFDLYLSPDVSTKVAASTADPERSAPGSLEMF